VTAAPYISGHCALEQQVRDGVVVSSATPDQFHSECPGATHTNGRVTVCACPHHEGEEIVPNESATACGRCGYTRIDSPRRPTGEGFRCVDVEACNERFERKMDTNPAFRRAVEFRQRQEAKRLEIARAEFEAGGESRARAKYGRCEYSGDPTRGGRFLPGNDAKLKGQLIRLADGGSVGAMAELLARGWIKDSARWPGTLAAKAEAAAQDEEFVTKRCTARWQRIEEGKAPEEAVR
jgi:hypothetical protein